jgi:hypothetical protein
MLLLSRASPFAAGLDFCVRSAVVRLGVITSPSVKEYLCYGRIVEVDSM